MSKRTWGALTYDKSLGGFRTNISGGAGKPPRITRSFFAISSERDGVILYSRCNFSGAARGAIHCPQQEKRSWDAVVTRISLSLRPLES
jgi:hypothetical protein